jgi:hypothetical protein
MGLRDSRLSYAASPADFDGGAVCRDRHGVGRAVGWKGFGQETLPNNKWETLPNNKWETLPNNDWEGGFGQETSPNNKWETSLSKG